MNTLADPRQDRLFQLLPAIYRIRDEERGFPLRAWLRVMAAQVNVVEDDIAQLYDNWFIETCQDWVVPYIGDLVGWHLVQEAGLPGDSPVDQARNRALIPRREIAAIIRSRRRKGSLALLEELAISVAGWPARAVEYSRNLVAAQGLNHLNLDRGRTLDLRDAAALDRINSPFDTFARTAGLRRPNSAYATGLYNTPSVALYVWRLRSYALNFAPATCVEEVAPNCFTFSVLGHDSPLFNQPVPETDPTTIAGIANVPGPISRRALDAICGKGHGRRARHCASADYYGEGKSFAIWRMVAQRDPGDPKSARVKYVPQLIPRGAIVVADLSSWDAAPPRRGSVAVDPVLGRMLFPEEETPKQGIWVAYHYGFSANIGGGSYPRPMLQPAAEAFTYLRVSKTGDIQTIEAALHAWRSDPDAPPRAIVEITDNAVYTERLRIELRKGESLQLRAASGFRPVIRLLDWRVEGPDVLAICGEPGSRFELDGIVVSGRNVELGGDLSQATFRHCTLVPGWSLQCGCEPKRPTEPSLDILAPNICVVIEHSIVGRIQVRPEVPSLDVAEPEGSGRQDVQRARCSGIGPGYRLDPITISITDSIVDATSDTREAIGAPGCPVAHASLTILRSTVIGRVEVHNIELGEDSIFTGRIFVARRQAGCLRFSSVVPESRTPRRYRCLPDLVDQNPATRDAERIRVRPIFRGTRYGSPDYCRLSDRCAPEVLRGAHDEAEMGVFHDLYQAQRLANLRARLEEFVPASSDAGVLFAD
ncbi:MAG: hypothetical protein ABI806_17490 [Candidatus Solibacter sp.]